MLDLPLCPDDQGGYHRDLRLGHMILGLRSLEQGSHPSLDLVSISEVINAIADSLSHEISA